MLSHSVAPRRRLIFLSGVVPVLVTALLSIYRPHFFDRLDRATYDIVLRMAGTKPPGPGVVIVDVDERSLATVGQWPWRRDVVGRLIAALHDAGASVIAIDVIFAESDRSSVRRTGPASSPDEQLAAALRGRGVILGYGLTFDPGAPSTRPCALRPLGLAVIQPPGDGAQSEPYFQATGAVCNLPALAQAAAGSGFLNAIPDADGILRRVPLIAELDGHVYPSLALSAVTAATGGGHPALQVSNVNASTLTIGGLAVPLDGKSNLLLAYRGRKRSFPYVSAADVLAGTGVGDVAARKDCPGRHDRARHARGRGHAARHPVRRRGSAGDGRRQPDAAGLHSPGGGRDAGRRRSSRSTAGVLMAAIVAGTGVTAGLVSAGALIAGLWWGAAWLLLPTGCSFLHWRRRWR